MPGEARPRAPRGPPTSRASPCSALSPNPLVQHSGSSPPPTHTDKRGPLRQPPCDEEPAVRPIPLCPQNQHPPSAEHNPHKVGPPPATGPRLGPRKPLGVKPSGQRQVPAWHGPSPAQRQPAPVSCSHGAPHAPSLLGSPSSSPQQGSPGGTARPLSPGTEAWMDQGQAHPADAPDANQEGWKEGLLSCCWRASPPTSPSRPAALKVRTTWRGRELHA